MHIHGVSRLQGIDYALPVASAQLKSALLLAGLYAAGRTCVTEPAVTRDHTERMLAWFGCPVERGGGRICVESGPLRARNVQVPGDVSSAAFFIVAASIVPGSDLTLSGVGINSTRSAVIDILNAMGAGIEIGEMREVSGEAVADLRVCHQPLHGVRIPKALVPIAIDEFPAILIAAAFARGETVLTDAAELRVKESDRIQAMADGLTVLGIRNEPRADGITVTGGRPRAGEIDSRGDHRIAMAFAVAGLAAAGPLRIRDCANVDTSFPGFPAALQSLGGRIEVS
jgi:3-phosphoshikimate 1-carboxyvinyltransferase